MATTMGVIKPHMDNHTNFGTKKIHVHPKVDNFLYFVILLVIVELFHPQTNHEIIT